MANTKVTVAEGYLSTKEAAELLGVSRGTITYWRLNGRLRAIRRSGNLYYEREALERMRRQREQGVPVKGEQKDG